jgi:hypothetical protein
MNSQVKIKTMDELTTTNQNFQSNLSHTRTIVAHTDQKVVDRIEIKIFEIRELMVSNRASEITETELEK